MHIFMFLFVAFLFFVLTPGIFVSLPPKGSKLAVNLTHAVLFALVWTLIHKLAWEWAMSYSWIDGNVQEGAVSGFGQVNFLNVKNE